jgi:hypothetical protein
MGWLNSVGGSFTDVVHAAGDGDKAATKGYLWDSALNGAEAGTENAQTGSGVRTVETLGEIANLAQPSGWIADPQGNQRLAGGLWHGTVINYEKDPFEFAGYAVGTVGTFFIQGADAGDATAAAEDAGKVADATDATNAAGRAAAGDAGRAGGGGGGGDVPTARAGATPDEPSSTDPILVVGRGRKVRADKLGAGSVFYDTDSQM